MTIKSLHFASHIASSYCLPQVAPPLAWFIFEEHGGSWTTVHPYVSYDCKLVKRHPIGTNTLIYQHTQDLTNLIIEIINDLCSEKDLV